eukprot:TRINITY_DN40637_c0_g1_i1.p1 TRINITY_DN40637_c0_g1~~TRINITY_DN40637_c0_g1_i1.p1  ORF type:complete len:460 (+),score=165.49 TRINITY_DN40637_c0_g1_i1:150-1529(+)
MVYRLPYVLLSLLGIAAVSALRVDDEPAPADSDVPVGGSDAAAGGEKTAALRTEAADEVRSAASAAVRKAKQVIRDAAFKSQAEQIAARADAQRKLEAASVEEDTARDKAGLEVRAARLAFSRQLELMKEAAMESERVAAARERTNEDLHNDTKRAEDEQAKEEAKLRKQWYVVNGLKFKEREDEGKKLGKLAVAAATTMAQVDAAASKVVADVDTERKRLAQKTQERVEKVEDAIVKEASRQHKKLIEGSKRQIAKEDKDAAARVRDIKKTAARDLHSLAETARYEVRHVKDMAEESAVETHLAAAHTIQALKRQESTRKTDDGSEGMQQEVQSLLLAERALKSDRAAEDESQDAIAQLKHKTKLEVQHAKLEAARALEAAKRAARERLHREEEADAAAVQKAEVLAVVDLMKAQGAESSGSERFGTALQKGAALEETTTQAQQPGTTTSFVAEFDSA